MTSSSEPTEPDDVSVVPEQPPVLSPRTRALLAFQLDKTDAEITRVPAAEKKPTVVQPGIPEIGP